MENESMEILTEEEAMKVNGGCGGSRTFWNGGHDDAIDNFIDDVDDVTSAMADADSEIGAVAAGIGEAINELGEDMGYGKVD